VRGQIQPDAQGHDAPHPFLDARISQREGGKVTRHMCFFADKGL